METNKASEAPSKRLYEVFEPYCRWRTEEGQEILEIDLKGFKREQVKVQANGKGMLIISGQRPVMNATKWIHFRKETTLPKDCNYKDIRAKLSKGFLSITMPTKLPPHQLLPPPPENNNSSEAQKNYDNKKGSIWGVKIDKGRFLRVAAVVTAAVFIIAIARLAEVYRHPSHDAAKDHVHV